MVDIDSFWFKLIKSIWACLVSAYSGTTLVIITNDFLHRNRSEFLQELPFNFYTSFLIGTLALSVLILLGLPTQAFLQAIKRTGWVTAAFTGLIIGAVVSSLVFVLREDVLNIDSRWRVFAIGCALGVFYASIFWLIRRPDKDDTKPRRAPATFKVTTFNE